MTIAEIEDLARREESESIEFKRSTGQLGRAAEALCAFLNGRGGSVLVGVAPDRKIIGQFVNDSTLQDVAQVLKRFDPAAPTQIHRVYVPDSGHEVLVLEADASHESRPFTFDGRPYERIGSTTSLMAQEKYQRLLLERAHASHRWANLSAALSLDDLDYDEILKTARLGIAAGRMSPSVAPTPVVYRHADDQVLNLVPGSGSTQSALATAVVFLSDQFPMPSQPGLGSDDGGDFTKGATAEYLGLGCQAAALVLVQTELFSSELLAGHPVLLPKVIDRVALLLPNYPATESSSSRNGSKVRRTGPE